MIDFCFLEKLERVPLGARSFSPCISEALLSGVGSAASGVAGLVGTFLTNKSNQKINQQNLEFAKEQWERERDYNTWMWMQNNLYNTPENQVKRYDKAGINPALALQNISTGSGSAQSSPSASTPSSIPMQSPDFSQLGNAFNTYIQNKMVEQQINNAQKEGEKIDAETRQINAQAGISEANLAVAAEMAKSSLADLIESTAGKRSQREYLDRQIPHIGGKLLAEKIQAEQGIDMNRLTLLGLQMDMKMKELNLRFLPEQLKQNLALIGQQIQTEVAKQAMSYAEAKAAMKQAVLLAEQANGQKIENWKADSLAWDILERSRLETGAAQRAAAWSEWENQYEKSPFQKFGRLVRMTNDKYNPLSGLIKMFK